MFAIAILIASVSNFGSVWQLSLVPVFWNMGKIHAGGTRFFSVKYVVIPDLEKGQPGRMIYNPCSPAYTSQWGNEE